MMIIDDSCLYFEFLCALSLILMLQFLIFQINTNLIRNSSKAWRKRRKIRIRRNKTYLCPNVVQIPSANIYEWLLHDKFLLKESGICPCND